jgi:peptide/nickel transport system permease protein
MRRTGLVLLACAVAVAAAAPFLAPHDPGRGYDDYLHAPPTPLHLRDAAGRWHWPFFHPLRLVDRLESTYEEDTSRAVALQVFVRGSLVAEQDESAGPWLPLGADSFGRDMYSRILYGARVSLGVALVAVAGSLLIGLVLGGVSGYFGGALDELLMRLAEFVVVLPTVYLVLALRSVLPLVLTAGQIFALMAGIFTLVGWPYVARGVRGIVAVERRRDYAEAARAAGASPVRILCRDILPATAGHLGIQATLLLPAFILAEATLSFVGVGFFDPTPTWGTMLHDAANVSTLGQFPWMLAPAFAIFVVVLGVNLVVQGSRTRSGAGSIDLAAR